MITIPFLMGWAARSAVLVLGGALFLWALRVRTASVRLAVWTAVLCSSMAIPLMTTALPKMAIPVKQATPSTIPPNTSVDAAPLPIELNKKVDWVRAGFILYALVAGTLLLRLGTGLAMTMRLRRSGRPTGQLTAGIEIRESERIASPVAVGILRPSILLPVDWREWDGVKLNAVLAHERSHILRRDPAVQMLSAIHRALLWFSPLSWFLHQRLVRAAEDASDDAAVESTSDRASYAKVLLEFMQTGTSTNGLGVPMARYGRPDDRIHRILDGIASPGRLTRWGVAAILALALPLSYIVAVIQPIYAHAAAVDPQVTTDTEPAPQTTALSRSDPEYLSGLGAVAANTVTIKSRIEGQLMSVSFREGDLVQAGQVLAVIDPRPFQLQLVQAEGDLARQQAQAWGITHSRESFPPDQIAQAEGSLKTAQAKVEEAKLQLNYTQITSPITGVAGLLLVDPGNVVRTSDTNGIVVINQLQPISVVFTIPEDNLPLVRARLKGGSALTVEAWSRDVTVKRAVGRLTALDNQIDATTGTVKLKAAFDNKDGGLFPNQFVNVRLLLGSK